MESRSGAASASLLSTQERISLISWRVLGWFSGLNSVRVAVPRCAPATSQPADRRCHWWSSDRSTSTLAPSNMNDPTCPWRSRLTLSLFTSVPALADTDADTISTPGSSTSKGSSLPLSFRASSPSPPARSRRTLDQSRDQAAAHAVTRLRSRTQAVPHARASGRVDVGLPSHPSTRDQPVRSPIRVGNRPTKQRQSGRKSCRGFLRSREHDCRPPTARS